MRRAGGRWLDSFRIMRHTNHAPTGTREVESRRRRRHLAFGALLLAATATGCGGQGARSGDQLWGAVLDHPLPKPEFVLTTTAGEPYDFRRETAGYVTLLFFGYTHCPDICPVHMANIAAVLPKLPPRVADRVKVVMVTVDPARDTPQRLRAWLDNFSRDFVGLTGSDSAIAAVQRSLGLPPAVREGSGQDYSMGHVASVLAFTADDSAHVVYPSGVRQVDWAHDLPLLVAQKWKAP